MSTIHTRGAKRLKDHMSFIATSAAAYDTGNLSEALRITVSLRVIFHQTNSSKALLEHLQGWGKLMVTDTPTDLHSDWICRDGNRTTFTLFSAQAMPFANSVYQSKPASSFARQVSAKTWWELNVLQWKEKLFSRREVALWIANKDRGAHLDDILPEDYVRFQEFCTEVKRDAQSGDVLEVPYPWCFQIMRQSAYELLHSDEVCGLAM